MALCTSLEYKLLIFSFYDLSHWWLQGNIIFKLTFTVSMKKVIMNHGAGGELMQEFISKHVISHLTSTSSEVPLEALDDSAVVDGIVFTTDGHTVNPLFFPGGDIGSLAIAGTVNDLSVIGGEALALSSALIIEEGLELETVDAVMSSMATTSRACGVPVVTGDTKVMEAGSIDKMVIVSSGIGRRSPYLDENLERASRIRELRSHWLTDNNVADGDAIIVSGNMGDHGVALLSFREGYGFEAEVSSDIAPLNKMMSSVLKAGGVVSAKDPTRGGLANCLNEWSSKSGVGIELDGPSIPVSEPVLNACELLGMDPLSIGNEGKVVIACVPEAADDVLAALRSHPEGRNAALIGYATDRYDRVVIRTEVGGRRVLETPAGDPVPRIC